MCAEEGGSERSESPFLLRSVTVPRPMIFTVVPRKHLGARGVFFFIAIEQKCQRGADADPKHRGDPVERRRTSQRKCRGHKNQPRSE